MGYFAETTALQCQDCTFSWTVSTPRNNHDIRQLVRKNIYCRECGGREILQVAWRTVYGIGLP